MEAKYKGLTIKQASNGDITFYNVNGKRIFHAQNCDRKNTEEELISYCKMAIGLMNDIADGAGDKWIETAQKQMLQ